MFFIEFLRSLPLVAVLGLGGYGYHWYVTQGLEKDINKLSEQVDACTESKAKLIVATEIQTESINRLENSLKKQKEAAESLALFNSNLISERDKYLSIFRKHDLTQLSLARPGMIEPRINNGTREVFEALERESRPQ